MPSPVQQTLSLSLTLVWLTINFFFRFSVRVQWNASLTFFFFLSRMSVYKFDALDCYIFWNRPIRTTVSVVSLDVLNMFIPP